MDSCDYVGVHNNCEGAVRLNLDGTRWVRTNGSEHLRASTERFRGARFECCRRTDADVLLAGVRLRRASSLGARSTVFERVLGVGWVVSQSFGVCYHWVDIPTDSICV